MQLDEISKRLAAGETVGIPLAELDGVVSAAEVLREEDTRLSGMIRVLELGGELVVAEQPIDRSGEALLHPIADRAAADQMVEARLEAYDRMWDGCGVKIDYGE
ncbi:MAG: hypothetical protein R6V85_05140 [Polyangia bacterium]